MSSHASNALAVSALVLGGIAFLIGFVPIGGILMGMGASVLAVLALKKHQRTGLAVTGLILGAVALLVSTGATALVLGVGIFRTQYFAPQAAYSVIAHGENSSTKPSVGDAPGSTAQNPAESGTEVTVGDYRVKVTSVSVLSVDELRKLNPLVPRMEQEKRFALVDYSITFTGSSTGTASDVGFRYVTARGDLINNRDGTIPGNPGSAPAGATLPTGASYEAQVTVEIPDDGGGLLRITEGGRAEFGIVEQGDETAYIKVR
ncbi:DUF4190 domain-containing protein [Mycetocola lacteus]|nr:DUF4190 domain-containing protein [Mycetocola lacteus]